MRDRYMEALREFSLKFDHYVGIPPVGYNITVPPWDVIDLRRRLITEEYEELDQALLTVDPIKLADGLADLLYVVFGTALAFGIPMDRIFQEVHRSNMTKSIEKIGGKSVKGEDFRPPQIEQMLFGKED